MSEPSDKPKKRRKKRRKARADRSSGDVAPLEKAAEKKPAARKRKKASKKTAAEPEGWLHRLLFTRIDIAGLVVFRVMFGILMAWDMGKFVTFGWVSQHYTDPPMTFGFIGFLWVKVLPPALMYAAFGITVGAAIGIALGAYYRLSCFLFFLGHTYVFLVGAEFYLNHAYLISVFAFLMIFIPAHRALSIDAIRVPKLYSNTVHRWPIVLMCGLFGVVYTYGAIAKLNADWMIGFEPIRHWLAHRAATASEPMATYLRHEYLVAFVAWGGTAFDMFVAPAIIWRRTRPIAVVLSYMFHLSNAYLFNIGVFPWFMMAATTLFFVPSWPRTRLGEFGRQIAHYIDDVVPEDYVEGEDVIALDARSKKQIIWALSGFFTVMILLPLRHHLYPNNVAWTEDGHFFSWRMKLRDKRGRITLRIKDKATGNSWIVNPRDELSPRQVRKMTGRPDLLLQYVHFLRDRYKKHDNMDVEIRADVMMSLNYRKEQRFIDPDRDLTQERHHLGAYDWVLPFEPTPLPSPVDKVDSHLGRAATRIRVIAQTRSGQRPRMPVRTAPLRAPR